MSSYWHDFIGGWVGGIYVIKNSIISLSGKDDIMPSLIAEYQILYLLL